MSALSVQRTSQARNEAVATDLLAELLIEHSEPAPAQARIANSLPAKIYAVMGVTTLLTFATLRTGYELLFSHQLFA